MIFRILYITWALALSAAAQTNAAPATPGPWTLLANAEVDGSGIYLQQLLAGSDRVPADLLLDRAPAVGQPVEWTPGRVAELAAKAGCPLVLTQWAGASKVRITRRTRVLEEAELRALVMDYLQREVVRDAGELELRFTRPWTPVRIADGPLTARVLDLPTSGVTANFIARVELQTGAEVLGSWQVPVQAHVWREIYVTRSAQPRGRLLCEADLGKERRDVLVIRDALASLEVSRGSLELAESLPLGAPVLLRSVRIRPVILRGRAVEALLVDGALTISTRVEALEDGLPGQVIRVRNPKSRRELQAKVQDEQTVIIPL